MEDIRFLLAPTFNQLQLQTLQLGSTLSYDLQKTEYLPGFIGLQNIKFNSHMNVILQALLHVLPLRDYFINASQKGVFEEQGRSELVKRLGMLYRKYWNPRNFKAQVSPHEFLQEVSAASAKKFRITEAGDPLDFLNWLLNALHRDLGGSKKPRSSESLSRRPASTVAKTSCRCYLLCIPRRDQSTRSSCIGQKLGANRSKTAI